MVILCEFLLSSRSAAGEMGLEPPPWPTALDSLSARSCFARKDS